ncbi:helix-turn-helix domain-containing protein [Arcobacter porcinus]|uniref:helix-turn-helix domain-containing protein n=1 Tax=Arcobacter porcinus TaxID=1935204 RepID=UPI00081E7505|nr:helix-turn-helix domain-containing protein [Arcobacter porcinus]OCL81897.1 Helix-turn-helix domain protein [Arcobacter porcinus]OCL86259.1 Helix-turn-helix domain protein [Arcobacter porcinus]
MPIQEDINYYIEEINKLGFKEKINLNVTETSNILGVSKSYLHVLRSKNIEIDYIEIGTKILYPKKSIAEFLANKINKTKRRIN